MKKAIILSLLLLCAGITLFSCSKSTDPVPVTEPVARISIESRDMVIGGSQYRIDVSVDNMAQAMTEAHLCIGYDTERFVFGFGRPGYFLALNQWQIDSCEEIKPDAPLASPNTALILIHLVKDTTGAVDIADNDCSSKQLYHLVFYVQGNRTRPIDTSAIRFYWADCNSNLIYFNSEEIPAQISAVHEGDGVPSNLPESWQGPLLDCVSQFSTENETPKMILENGVEIVWGDTLGRLRGDLNMNRAQYEISDAVMFTHYLIIGETAFGSHVDSSIMASDVNANGTPLEASDLQYLIRVIIGDALPLGFLEPTSNQLALSPTVNNGEIVVIGECPEPIGTIRLQYKNRGGISGNPDTVNGMDIFWALESDSILNVLIFNIGDAYFPAGHNEICRFRPTGSAELISAEASTLEGVSIPVVIQD